MKKWLLFALSVYFSQAFTPSQPLRRISLTDKRPLTANRQQDKEEPPAQYNDDAFGLVFLTGLLVAKDVVFCGVFASLSFIAAAVKSSRSKQDRVEMARIENYLLPPAVAVNALLTASVLSLLLDQFNSDQFVKIAAQPAWEAPHLLAATGASCVYGAYKYNQKP